MTELEALRHQVKMLEAQLISEREQSYRANLRDVELCQKAQRERDMLQAALWSVCRAMLGNHCTPSGMRNADACWQEAARVLWPSV